MKKIHIEVNMPLYTGDLCGFMFKESVHDSEVPEMTPVIERRIWRVTTVYPGTKVSIYDVDGSNVDRTVTPSGAEHEAVSMPSDTKKRKKEKLA